LWDAEFPPWSMEEVVWWGSLVVTLAVIYLEFMAHLTSMATTAFCEILLSIVLFIKIKWYFKCAFLNCKIVLPKFLTFFSTEAGSSVWSSGIADWERGGSVNVCCLLQGETRSVCSQLHFRGTLKFNLFYLVVHFQALNMCRQGAYWIVVLKW
jgi:hypothetical protein